MTYREYVASKLANKSKEEALSILEGLRLDILVSTDWLSQEDKEDLETLSQLKKQIEALVY